MYSFAIWHNTCALCGSYPCDKFNGLFENAAYLKNDNALLKEQGMEAWAKLQDGRVANGYTYQDEWDKAAK